MSASAAAALSRRSRRVRAGAVRELEATGETCISEEQRKVHVVTEAIAVTLVAPFQTWLAFQRTYPLPDWARWFSGAVGIGTILVDGGLLLSFMRKKKEGG